MANVKISELPLAGSICPTGLIPIVQNGDTYAACASFLTSAGTSGTSGAAGFSGTSGTDGATGASGTSGFSGTSGTSPAGGSIFINGSGICSIKADIGNNAAAGNCAVVSGGGGSFGYENRAFCDYGTIAGGSSNTVCAVSGSILGGCFNTVCVGASFSSVLGGCFNKANAPYSFVAGCNLNNTQPCTLMANNFVIGDFVGPYAGCSLALDASGKMCIGSGGGGGSSPMVVGGGTCSIIGNCTLNTAFGMYSFIGGGQYNQNYGTNGFVGGGCFNAAYADGSGIVGGNSNCIGQCYPNSAIGGGFCNQIVGGFSVNPGVTISGGVGNGTCGGSYSSFSNCWITPPSGFCMGALSFIGGGFQNNAICCQSVVVGGQNNMNCGSGSFIGAGQYNFILSSCGFIGNGVCNTLSCYGFSNSIVNGFCNTIFNGSSQTILGGCCHTIGCMNFSACNNIILGGTKGLMEGQFGLIGNSADCGVFSPCANQIGCATYGGVILSGANNSICGSFMPGSTNFYSTILNGCGNATYCCFNTVSGQGNFAMGNYTNVFGCGISGMSGCTTYFNNVCVCGTLSKSSGSFKIPHPDPVKAEAGKFLKHSFVESPTAGDNIYRFKVSTTNLSATIELPDYYKFLNENDQVWVSPVGHFGIAYGTVNADQTAVDLVSNADGEFNVLVIGTRKDKVAKDYWNGTEANEVENDEDYQKVLALREQMATDAAKRAEEEIAYKLAETAKAAEKV